jgi:hypothetical protein
MKHVPSSEQTTETKTNDTRRDMRFACDPATVQAHVSGYAQPVAAQVVQVSKSGVRLLVAEPLPEGAHVRVEIGALMVEGEIRHCKRCPDSKLWAVGILMLDVGERS